MPLYIAIGLSPPLHVSLSLSLSLYLCYHKKHKKKQIPPTAIAIHKHKLKNYLAPLFLYHGVSSGLFRASLTKDLYLRTFLSGFLKKTHLHHVSLRGSVRFLRTRHCVAGHGDTCPRIQLRVGRADPRNPPRREVLGPGRPARVVRCLPLRVRTQRRDPTAHKLSPHLPQRLPRPLDGIRAENVSAVSDTVHSWWYARNFQRETLGRFWDPWILWRLLFSTYWFVVFNYKLLVYKIIIKPKKKKKKKKGFWLFGLVHVYIYSKNIHNLCLVIRNQMVL